jgi:ankyrin repeat protein
MKNILVFTLFMLIQFSAHVSYAQRIMDAIQDGNLLKVEKWLNKESDVNEKFEKETEDGDYTEFHVIEWAAYHNQKEVLDLFIKEKDRFDYFNEWISDGLSANIHNCDIETVNKLLNAGASVNNLCNMCRKASPIAIALSYECYDIYNLLLSKEALLKNENAGFDVIHSAAAIDSLTLLKDLVENKGLDIELKNSGGCTSVFYAVSNGNLDNLLFLVNKGANLNHLDKDGFNLFHYAPNLAIFKCLETNLLAKDLFSIEELNTNHPLIASIVQKDNKELFDYYIANYSNQINKPDSDGRSALFYLLDVKNNKKYFFDELIKHNLNISLEDKYGKKLKRSAKKENDKELLSLIKNYEKTH